MKSKKHFADFWEELASPKSARERGRKVLKYIEKYFPEAKSILELGVGNGNVLTAFPKKYGLSGLDIEKKYVALAKKKLSNASFYVSSMHNFRIKQKFDVIFSVYDSINFLRNLKQWSETFNTVNKHLNKDGLFVFDFYTPFMLGIAKKWVSFSKEPFGFMMDKGIVKGNNLTWDFKIFEKKNNNIYEMHQTYFHERIFPVVEVERRLKKYFRIIEKLDEETLKKPTKSTCRLLYICRKKER
jgi:ubiquinone/menaquinone biosynthesis C-methylase UbiE